MFTNKKNEKNLREYMIKLLYDDDEFESALGDITDVFFGRDSIFSQPTTGNKKYPSGQQA